MKRIKLRDVKNIHYNASTSVTALAFGVDDSQIRNWLSKDVYCLELSCGGFVVENAHTRTAKCRRNIKREKLISDIVDEIQRRESENE